VAVHLHVVIQPDALFLPLREHIGLLRQRLQRGPVQLLVQLQPRTRQFAEWPLVEFSEQLPDGFIHLRQAEELALAQGRQNPTLDQQHALLDFGLVECQQLQAIPVD